VIVVDASAVLESLLRGRHSEAADRYLLDGNEPVASPHLLDLEVLQVLRRLVVRRQLDPDRAGQVLDDLEALPIARYEHLPMLRRIWWHRANLTAYDAAYLALAEALGASLVTCDAALGAAPGGSAQVVLLG
jgi:predicted nucleic acid-binding protein